MQSIVFPGVFASNQYISAHEVNKLPRPSDCNMQSKASRQTRESRTQLTEHPEIKERTLRHQVQAQTSDRDRIKGEIFRSHDTLRRIYEQKGKRE